MAFLLFKLNRDSALYRTALGEEFWSKVSKYVLGLNGERSDVERANETKVSAATSSSMSTQKHIYSADKKHLLAAVANNITRLSVQVKSERPTTYTHYLLRVKSHFERKDRFHFSTLLIITISYLVLPLLTIFYPLCT